MGSGIGGLSGSNDRRLYVTSKIVKTLLKTASSDKYVRHTIISKEQKNYSLKFKYSNHVGIFFNFLIIIF